VIALILMPLVLYKLYPPELKDTPDAPKAAQQKLKEMGPLTPQELIMLGTFVLLITFWIFGSMIGIGTVTTALLGFSILLLSGVLKWRDILEEKEAWSTLIWFAALLMMASFLTKFGMMQWFSNIMQSATAGYSWLTTVAILGLVYFYVHYLFASMTAHITSLYSAFLLVMIGAGAPPMAAAMGLAVLSSLCAGLTHYGAASAPVYFGAGYIRVQDWWRLGAIVALLNLVIWLTVGAAWWKLIGIL
jgi:DASS family divalent anion:Na+ symporter